METLIHSSHRVVAVYTAPDRPTGRGRKIGKSAVKVAAQYYGLPIQQPLSLRESRMQEELRALKADLMVVVAYGFLFSRLKKAVNHFNLLLNREIKSFRENHPINLKMP